MKANIHTKEQLTRLVERISASKLPISVDISKYKERKTLNQLRLVYKWFKVISTETAEATGKYYSQEVWKDYMKDLFGLREEIEMPDGKIKMVNKSLADYSIKEMSEFMEKIDHYCGSEFNIFLPSPNVPDEF